MAQNLFSRRRQHKRKQKAKRHNNEFFDEHSDASVIRECQVSKLSHEGRGIAKYKGKTQFIEGALIGETVSARLLSSSNTYDELQVVAVLEPSPDRVEPFCKHFSVCGGCSLQTMTSASQVQHKENVLQEQLTHFGKLDSGQRLEVINSDRQFYRSKARLGVYYDSNKDKIIIGFREKQSKRLTDIDDCPVMDKAIGRLLTPLRALLDHLDNARQITHVELAASDTEQALVFRHIQPFSEQDRRHLIEFSKQQKIRLFLQGEAGQPAIDVSGEAREMTYSLSPFDGSEIKLSFHPQDFTQVNTQVNKKLIRLALAQLDLNKNDRVLDLFCGLGNFTLPIALQSKEVVGVEGSENMVQRATKNAQENGIDNTAFFSADLHSDFRNTPWAKQEFSKILIDPPRAGALVVANYLHHFNAERIVYISCNPATLARDAGVLSTHGYRLLASGVIDMFPNTAHIESIAVFVRQAKG